MTSGSKAVTGYFFFPFLPEDRIVKKYFAGAGFYKFPARVLSLKSYITSKDIQGADVLLQKLERILSRIDGKGYKAYKDLQGQTFHFSDFDMIFSYVQGDPFASPSMISVKMPSGNARFPRESFEGRVRNRAAADYINRTMDRMIGGSRKGKKGSGKSGMIAIDTCCQEVLQKSSVVINGDFVEARLYVGLPAFGRKIAGKKAREKLIQEIPAIVEKGLKFSNYNAKDFWKHVFSVEDQVFMRESLSSIGLVAFIADGSILPRISGVNQRPLGSSEAVAFRSPPSLCIKMETPNGGTVSGMGIPEGITLIAGGGYHGKSTLLRALQRGVYDHIPGDGRERVVSLPKAIKIRAEDGRRVEGVNISPFINNLPLGKDTEFFCTDEASGSTSQAANIMEAVEIGADLLFLDEDTSATNFMIRDTRMQRLVAKEREPITPFVDKVRQLYNEKGISTVIVMGGSGDYFDVADNIIMMDDFLPLDVTQEARKIASENLTGRSKEGGSSFGEITPRVPLPESIDPEKGRKVKIKARGNEHIQFGYESIKLGYVEQIVQDSQTRAIGDIIYYALRNKIIDGKNTLSEIVWKMEDVLESYGIDEISPFGNNPVGNHARPRPLEIAAAINRLRTLKVEQKVTR